MNFEDLEDVRELSAAEVDALLHRRNGWASAHVCELGGYFEGRFRFPVHGIRRWQEARAAEYAERPAPRGWQQPNRESGVGRSAAVRVSLDTEREAPAAVRQRAR